MAYANLVISARAIQGPTAQDKPGFNFLAEMGAGLKAGAGFRVFASLGMPRFERFTARTIDLLVKETIGDLLSLLPQQSSAAAPMTTQSRGCRSDPSTQAVVVCHDLS